MPSDIKQRSFQRAAMFQVEIDMKFAFKSIVVAAAFIAAGAANAASVVVDGTTNNNGWIVEGTGGLEFSELLMGALNTGAVAVTPFGGATITTATYSGVDDFGDTYTYDAYTALADVTSLNYNPLNGKVINVQSVGGAAQTMAANPGIKAAGGSAQVGNLDVRFLANGDAEIYGSIIGQRLGATSGVNYSGLLFTTAASNVAGATSFVAAPGVYTTTLSNLALTGAGFNALVQSFGLNSSGLGYSALQQATASFGTLTSNLTVTAAVPAIPEPSTYALMGLGLVGIGFAARRRAAK